MTHTSALTCLQLTHGCVNNAVSYVVHAVSCISSLFEKKYVQRAFKVIRKYLYVYNCVFTYMSQSVLDVLWDCMTNSPMIEFHHAEMSTHVADYMSVEHNRLKLQKQIDSYKFNHYKRWLRHKSLHTFKLKTETGNIKIGASLNRCCNAPQLMPKQQLPAVYQELKKTSVALANHSFDIFNTMRIQEELLLANHF